MTRKGARWAPFLTAPGVRGRSARGAGRARGRVRRRRGGRGVLELLLGAEQRVEDLLAQPLADGERDAAREDEQHEQLAEAEAAAPLLLVLRGLAESDGRVAERLGGRLHVLLEPLVVEDRLRRRLAVLEAADGAAGVLVGGPEVLAQLLVLHDPLDVGALPHRDR